MVDILNLRTDENTKSDQFVNFFLPKERRLEDFTDDFRIKIKVFIICVLFSLPVMFFFSWKAMGLFGLLSVPTLVPMMGVASILFYLINLRITGKHMVGATIFFVTTTIETCVTVYYEQLFEAGNIYWVMAYVFLGVYIVAPWIVFVITSITLAFISSYLYLIITDHVFPFAHHFQKEILIYNGSKSAFIIVVVSILSYFYEKGRLKNIDEIDKINNDLYEEIRKIQKIQHEKEDIMAKLIETEKLASLGEMAGGIAHEINNPLAIIDGTIRRIYRIMGTKPIDTEKVYSYLNDIHTVTKRVVKIINGLRSFARDGNDDPWEEIKVGDIIENVKYLSSERFKSKGINFQLDIKNYESIMRCRRVQVEQVILNLLNNAYDAVIELPEKWIKITSEDRLAFTEISVVDSGPGIPENIIEKIMFPFFTTKKVGKGTGLGLSISRGIVENHLGTLTIDLNSPNTKFVINLPLVR